jgi:hypothetical protein
MLDTNKFMICNICREKLEHKEKWAKEHLEKYPTHKSYRLEKIKVQRLCQ